MVVSGRRYIQLQLTPAACTLNNALVLRLASNLRPKHQLGSFAEPALAGQRVLPEGLGPGGFAPIDQSGERLIGEGDAQPVHI